ncbi:MAG: hypothetical protein C0600_09450 [Ignavibacteria bacterium]|nr:MAG: hypothetical protein C0600_09450 [Ignavibacteria bacterium]
MMEAGQTRLTRTCHRLSAASLRSTLLLTVLATVFITSSSPAQPLLSFKRITVNWPTIELYFDPTCDGRSVGHELNKNHWRIFEDGVEVPDFTFWCPDPLIRCAGSFSFVMDASGSMRGVALDTAKKMLGWYIDLMDGVLDEAAIIEARKEPRVALQMTTRTPRLKENADSLTAIGASGLYDGIMLGIHELIHSGVNQCRAVLVFTDGWDNVSTATAAEIISLANRNRIRVFTIGTGLILNETPLEMIALLTGGRYYRNPRAGQMAAIYQEISTIIFQGFQECVITYQRDCADGSMRTVEMELQNLCGGKDSRSKTYRAPLDSTTFDMQYLSIGDTVIETGDSAVLTVNLDPVPHDWKLRPFELTVGCTNASLPVAGIRIPRGSALEGVPLTTRRIENGVRVRLDSEVPVSASGPILELQFAPALASDSMRYEVEAIITDGEGTCRGTVVNPGGFLVVPRLLPRIDHEDTVYLCRESTRELTANEGFISYRWSTGDTTRMLIVAQPGVYHVDVVDRYGDTLRSAETVVQYPAERKVWIEADGPLDFCLEESVVLHVAGDVEGCKIFWRQETHPHDALRAKDEGAYYAQVEDLNGCRYPTDTVYVQTWNPPFTLNVSESVITICRENSIELRVEDDFPGYEWSTGDTARSIHARAGGGDRGKYYVRVVGENGCRSAWKTVEVYAYPKRTLSILPSTSVVLCAGDSVVVHAGEIFEFYRWSTGDTTRSITVHKSGEYILTATDENGCNVSESIQVIPADSVMQPRIGTPHGTVLCADEALLLDGGDQYVAWKWSTGDSTRLISIRDTGSYFVDVTAHGGCVLRSDTLSISREEVPEPQIEASGGTLICPGDSLRLSVPQSYASYLWNTGERTSEILVHTPGTYVVTVLTQGSCENTATPVQVRLRMEVPPPIMRSGDLLSTTTKVLAHQWFLDDAEISGATGSTLQLPGTGRYAVEVIDSCGRRLRSDDLLVTTLDVPPPHAVDLKLHVYPEPVRDILYLRIDEGGEINSIEIHDLLGRLLLKRSMLHGSTHRIDVSSLPPGMYLLRLRHQNGLFSHRFTKFNTP